MASQGMVRELSRQQRARERGQRLAEWRRRWIERWENARLVCWLAGPAAMFLLGMCVRGLLDRLPQPGPLIASGIVFVLAIRLLWLVWQRRTQR